MLFLLMRNFTPLSNFLYYLSNELSVFSDEGRERERKKTRAHTDAFNTERQHHRAKRKVPCEILEDSLAR